MEYNRKLLYSFVENLYGCNEGQSTLLRDYKDILIIRLCCQKKIPCLKWNIMSKRIHEWRISSAFRSRGTILITNNLTTVVISVY